MLSEMFGKKILSLKKYVHICKNKYIQLYTINILSKAYKYN